MFAVNFYASCFVSRRNSIGKKLIRLNWEKAVYPMLFTLTNNLDDIITIIQNLDPNRDQHLHVKNTWVFHLQTSRNDIQAMH